MSYPVKSTQYAIYWMDTVRYMCNPSTEKPLLVDCESNRIAIKKRLEFYAFRSALRKEKPELVNSELRNLDQIEVRVKDTQLEFSLKDEDAMAEKFAQAFKARGFDPVEDA